MPHSMLSDRPLPLAVCAAVVCQADKILITKRPADKPHGGLWEFPGGKLDPGESPHHSLRRELREELAIRIEVGPILETVYHHYDWGAVLILAYLCRWRSGDLHHLEVADHRWLHPAELCQYPLLPADQPLRLTLEEWARARQERPATPSLKFSPEVINF